MEARRTCMEARRTCMEARRTCMEARRRGGPWRRRALVVIALYLVVLAVNRSMVVVRGGSMDPTLWAGDRLLTVPGRCWPRRVGQVVVVADPTDAGHRVVKRVAAVTRAGIDVRGDAPERSTDSRTWGPVPAASVRRVALARWPDLRTPLRRRVTGGA